MGTHAGLNATTVGDPERLATTPDHFHVLGVKALATELPQLRVVVAGWSQRTRPGLRVAIMVTEAAAIIAADKGTMLVIASNGTTPPRNRGLRFREAGRDDDADPRLQSSFGTRRQGS